MRFLVRLLVLGQDQAILRLGFQRLQSHGHGVDVVADPDVADTGGETWMRSLASPLAIRVCPHAGCSRASSKMRRLTASATQFFGFGTRRHTCRWY